MDERYGELLLLDQELAIAEQSLEIERSRHGKRMQVDLEIAPEAR